MFSSVLPSARRRAWTLLELLVVLSILVVLTLLAFPTYRAVIAAGYAAGCVSNLRFIYTATLAFTEDHNGQVQPALGYATERHPLFNRQGYWWSNAYLGRYLLNQRNRSRDGIGRLTQREAAGFNCPARLVEGPDAKWVVVEKSPAISYLMVYPPDEDANLRIMQERSKKLYLTEGRFSTMWRANCKTGVLGIKNTGRRLRRYHNGSLHLLFFDGHVVSFSGSDEEIALMVPKS